MKKLCKSQRRAAEDLLRSARAAKNTVLADRALSRLSAGKPKNQK